MNSKRGHAPRLRSNFSGFTLVELMVTIAIFTVVTSVTLAEYPKFGSKINLELVASTVALYVRQAQAYGLGVRGFQGNFPAYGVNVSPSNSEQFNVFADKNGDNFYTSDELLETYSITGSERVTDVLADDTSVGCLDVTYRKPRPDARFCFLDANCGGPCQYTNAGKATIKISSQRGNDRGVVIYKNGQVEVKCLSTANETCPI